MSSRHRETIARRTLAFARLVFHQRQAISVSASGAGRKSVESFQSLALLHANPAFPQRPTQTRLGNGNSAYKVIDSGRIMGSSDVTVVIRRGFEKIHSSQNNEDLGDRKC